MRTLVLGGARSGKSAYAEQLAKTCGKQVIYIATAQAGDDEMVARIGHHRARRPHDWRTVEEPFALGDALIECAGPERLIVVDCLTLWLSNVMGMGIIPFGAAARSFADEAGRLNQAVAALCERVVLVAAGLPLMLKDTPC